MAKPANYLGKKNQPLSKKPDLEHKKKIDSLVQEIDKMETGVPGGNMRACIVAALHFEFEVASKFGCHSETKDKFNED